MKSFYLFTFAALFALSSFGAASQNVHFHLNNEDTEQLSGIKFSYIWVAQVTKELQGVEKQVGDETEARTTTNETNGASEASKISKVSKSSELVDAFEHRGEQYRFLGSGIIDYQDVLKVEAHSASSLSIELTPQGEQKLATATAENIGKQMALLINDEVVNIVTVQMKLGAKMIVTGLSETQINYMLSR